MTEKPAIRILVLDDEPFMLRLLARLLSGLGFTTVTACDNGYAALERVDDPDESPDLILLDLNMPEMDGVEFVRRLTEHYYAGSLILVSGEDERTLHATVKLVRAHRIPVLGYLHKPVTRERLEGLLEGWTPAQGAGAPEKVYGPDEVRAAIANGELLNHYQPQVEIATGRVVGIETLVRWQHSEDGLVYPARFLGVAEAHGLIDNLTHAVLAEALAQARCWQDRGLDLRVAINVSMDNLAAVDFADFVAGQAAVAGVPQQQVVLEVTESQLARDLRAPLEVLMRLRLKRFRVSIDDFGTGHSSLVQLRDIPFDELKIDQGFVHGAWNDAMVRAMFDASLGLAKQLDMEIVAEGVEDRDDWEFLRRSGCDLAQGFFIARPMPADDLPAWLDDWGRRVRDELMADAPFSPPSQDEPQRTP